MEQRSFLIVSYPIQGHINPALRLAHRLALLGAADVTFVTTVSADRQTKTNATRPPPTGVSFAPFSDGHDENSSHVDRDNYEAYQTVLRRRGSQALAELIARRPYTCLIYTPLFHWAADVAAEHGVPAALLWVQAATVFDVIYYYLHGYADIITERYHSRRSESFDQPLSLPGLPLDLAAGDLPSFMVDTSDNWFYANVVKFLEQQFEKVDPASRRSSKILVNTFDALEPEALRAVSKLSLVGIGPLVQLDHRDRSEDRSTGKNNIIEWLSSKPARSVVYVAFGSVARVSKVQAEEIAKGLLEFGRPFLWVRREKETDKEDKAVNSSNWQEELDKLGLVVPWCDQVRVLDNEALGCFVSHCGWNSTLEGLACGVPIVAVPQFVDQMTNAKLVEEFWKVGVRARANNEEGIVESGEIKRCLGLVMEGDEGFIRKANAKKWKGLAREATMEGGSLDRNLMAFVNEMINGEAKERCLTE